MASKFALLLCFLFSAASLAKSTDFKEQLSIDADRTEGSLQEQTLTYCGNVVVKQGSLTIRADCLKVDASKGKGKEKIIATGRPAKYTQLLDGDKPVDASAEEITYDLGVRLLVLVGNAEIAQMSSKVSSARIQYDLEKERLVADGKTENERVRTVFTVGGE